jgi:hypothetical protein
MASAPKISSSRFKAAEFKRTVYRATPERGTTLEQLQKPEYWAHVAANARDFDLIEVIPEDGEYFAQLVVTKCDRINVWTALICFIPLQEAAAVVDADIQTDDGGDYEFKWKGPKDKMAIIRKSDGVKVSDGHDNKVAAQAWLKDYLKKAA